MTQAAYPIREEIANAITHGLGIAAAIVALVLMLVKGIPELAGSGIAAISIYGATLILMFLASTLYHAIMHPGAKQILKRLDHSAIYLLIAGTYTPFLLISLKTPLGYALLALIWAAALAGVVFKSLFAGRYPRLSLLTYVAMGWASVLIVPSLYQKLPLAGFILLLLGGLAYSLGTFFYAAKQRSFSHAVWHIFVLAGATLHCLCIALYVIP